MSDFDFEPIRGLPERLPNGETLLWQGAPGWRSLALRALHVRGVAIYFGVLLVWQIASKASDGVPPGTIATSAASLAGMGLVAIGLLCLFAWLVARTTVYSITTARVVLRFGVALPMTISIPFRRVDGAALKLYKDGSGDIPLTLKGQDRIAYMVIWPHARPWRLSRAQPMFRAIPQAEQVAQILARAVATGSRVKLAPAPGAIAPDAVPSDVYEPATQTSAAA